VRRHNQFGERQAPALSPEWVNGADPTGGRRGGLRFRCKGQQESSSFLKKRTKNLLLASVRTSRIGRVNQTTKSLLVLFFRKELLASRLLSFGG
jgi:hypothetical protein